MSPRIRYVARLVFQNLLGLELRFTHDKEEYLLSTLPKINYSRDFLQSGIYLQCAHLLFETDISEQELKPGQYKGVPTLFQSSQQSHLPFDPLAASFYLVSRYEEYMPFIPDEHLRFPAQESILYKIDALSIPLVNAWAEIIADLLKEQNPSIEFKKPQYQFYNSVDIDNAAAFLGKGIFRALGGYLQDIISLNFRRVLARSRCIFIGEKDPFDTFDFVLSLQEKYKFQTIYFALFGRMGQYDRSLTRYSTRLQRYLKGIADFCEMGIHPSYRSNDNYDWLEEEITALQRVLKKDITKSRQHFLKLKFPSTYRNLLQLELTDDYSMGYASEHGFRAGICTPFRFYDLEQEIETPLLIHPFPFMDGTFIYYLKQKPADAWPIIEYYIETYRKYGGELIPIWHNRIYSEKEAEWEGWNEIFEKMVKAAV
ncbi:polysaccharide deacetylase family protein [Croceimicrobium hydrocarbonivorans]|uniref:Polysaccharide deacetylase family protein n=1 Tax=Croceimicrobium hydrocarbonivorans TaxID=2761580 RepID=A0A7H0VGG4_9FLAO|nr:polysaccharide deacetylase family protein [Croceimicrobium hydrocarbonivorans]QNR24812.1 polysaccharide deacetylase family protein [Croceimicrobium hydrocarbonivorans]